MSSAEELIREVQNEFSGMGDNLDALQDFTDLICLLLTAPDIEGECPGLHRLVLVMRKHLQDVRERHDKTSKAIRRLAYP